MLANLARHTYSLLDEFKDLLPTRDPLANVYTDDGKYCIELQVPGMAEENISVTTSEQDGYQFVNISGKVEKRQSNDRRKDKNFITTEYTYSSFNRTFVIPDQTVGEPTAVLKNGILTLTWDYPDKKREAVPRKIPITSS